MLQNLKSGRAWAITNQQCQRGFEILGVVNAHLIVLFLHFNEIIDKREGQVPLS